MWNLPGTLQGRTMTEGACCRQNCVGANNTNQDASTEWGNNATTALMGTLLENVGLRSTNTASPVEDMCNVSPVVQRTVDVKCEICNPSNKRGCSGVWNDMRPIYTYANRWGVSSSAEECKSYWATKHLGGSLARVEWSRVASCACGRISTAVVEDSVAASISLSCRV